MRTNPALTVLAAGLIALAGCSTPSSSEAAQSPPTSAPGASTSPPPTASSPDESAATSSAPDPSSASTPSGGGSAETSDDDTAAEGTDAPIPTSAVDYADDFVRAWGRGDDAREAQLSTENVPIMLRRRATDHWARTTSEGAAGSIYVTYEEEQTGDSFVLRVDNAKAGQGQEHAVVDVRLNQPR